MTKYDLSFLELVLKELLKKLKKHNTYAKQLEDEIILYAQENARLKEKNEEIERKNNIINDINYFIEQRCNEDINDTEKAILQSIELISKGIIKVVKK